RKLAEAIAAGVKKFSRELILVGLAGSPMLQAFAESGFTVAAEAFADRRYEPDGTPRARKLSDARLRNPAEAAPPALAMVPQGTVTASDGSQVPVHAETICIHGDTPGSVQIAAAVWQALRRNRIALLPLAAR